MHGSRLDHDFLAEIRRRTSLAELIGSFVALKRVGRELRGLCPFHRERTPSFYVIEDKAFWHCFGCGESGDAIKWVTKTTHADFRTAALWLAERAGIDAERDATPQTRAIVRRPAAEMVAARDRERIATAQAIWGSRRDPRRSPAERYWRGRRLSLPMPPTIAFVERLPHPFLPPDAAPYPAMVAAIQGPDEGRKKRVCAVHCTYLPRPGEPADRKGRALPPPGWRGEWKPKLMRGVARAGAVRLTPAKDLMLISEGIETGASLLQGLYDPEVGTAHVDGEPLGVWAALSQGNLGTIWLPDHVREVIIAADSDGKIPNADDSRRLDPEAILDRAAARHAELHRTVRLARPPAGSDFNDLLVDGTGAPVGDDLDDDLVEHTRLAGSTAREHRGDG